MSSKDAESVGIALSAAGGADSGGVTIGPLFVGGMDRSGTHVLSHLLGKHSQFLRLPREVTFHTIPAGLPGYVEGRIERDGLIEELRNRWWDPPRHAGVQTRGLADIMDRERFEAALRAFAEAPGNDRPAAGRILLSALFDPLAAEAGKSTWIEKTPWSIVAAPFLASLFPKARFVHVVRDGRDVATSLSKMPWGFDSAREGLRRWAKRMRRIDAAVKELPPDHVHTLHLEDLTFFDRENSYRELLGFLGVSDEPEIREFFESEVTAERAHLGRSQAELSPAERAEINALYADALAELRRDGIPFLPPERSLAEAFAATDGEPPNPLDPWSPLTAGQFFERTPESAWIHRKRTR